MSKEVYGKMYSGTQIEVKTAFKTDSYDVSVRHYSVIPQQSDKDAFYGNELIL